MSARLEDRSEGGGEDDAADARLALGRGEEVLGAGDGGDEDVRFVVDLQHQWGQWNAGTGMNGGAYALDARVGRGDVRDDVAALYGFVERPGRREVLDDGVLVRRLVCGEVRYPVLRLRGGARRAFDNVPRLEEGEGRICSEEAGWCGIRGSGCRVGWEPYPLIPVTRTTPRDMIQRRGSCHLRGIDGLNRLYIAIAGYLTDGIGAACIRDYMECALRMLGG